MYPEPGARDPHRGCCIIMLVLLALLASASQADPLYQCGPTSWTDNAKRGCPEASVPDVPWTPVLEPGRVHRWPAGAAPYVQVPAEGLHYRVEVRGGERYGVMYDRGREFYTERLDRVEVRR